MGYFVLTNAILVILLLYLFFKDKNKKHGGTFNINKKGRPLDFTEIFSGRAKELNVVFNHNGESWDAYEVLGLPAGSSLEEVEKAFKNSAQTDLMKAAYKAIKPQ